MKNTPVFSLLGNPNCGKTAVFNLLTGMDQKVSNYPGITVEKKISTVKINDSLVSFEDYPGSYSFQPQSLDEKIVHDTLFAWMNGLAEKPDGILYVADITNLRRNLYFCTQLLMLDIPIIILLNMSDLAAPDTIINVEELEKNLNVYKIIPFSASKKIGLKKLENTLTDIASSKTVSVSHNTLRLTKENKKLLSPISEVINNNFSLSEPSSENLSLSILSSDNYYKSLRCSNEIKEKLLKAKNDVLGKVDKSMHETIETLEPDLRYGFVDEILDKSHYKDAKKVGTPTFSEKIDNILTHAFLGPMIYIGILYFIFQSIFTFATIPMDIIDGGITALGNKIYALMPEGQ